MHTHAHPPSNVPTPWEPEPLQCTNGTAVKLVFTSVNSDTNRQNFPSSSPQVCKTQCGYTPSAQGESALPRTHCYLPKINQLQCKSSPAREETCKQNRLPVFSKDSKAVFKEGGTNMCVLKQGSGTRGGQLLNKSLCF